MDVLILDEQFNTVAVIDDYLSMIWTDRFDKAGDFELYMTMRDGLLDEIQNGFYVSIEYSDRLMIVDKTVVKTDAEDGNTVTFTGHSLEFLLDRRVIWGSKTYKGKLEDCIETILNQCLIDPEIPERKVDNFVFDRSGEEKIEAMTMANNAKDEPDEKAEEQYNGESLYSLMCTKCDDKKIGFKVLKDASGVFHFQLYSGVDRSYEQNERPYIVISPEFDNLINSNYAYSTENYRTIALVGGTNNKDEERVFVAAGAEGFTGFDRREVFFSNFDIARTTEMVDDGTGYTYIKKLTEEEYRTQLDIKGKEALDKLKQETAFEGSIDATNMYQYGVDYNLGDIVQIENEYGQGCPVRVYEMVFSMDENGLEIYPTFTKIDDDEEAVI